LVEAARARLLALVAAPGSLAPAGADAAADAMAAVLGARSGLQFVQFHGLRLDAYQIGDAVDHAAHGRRVLHLDHVVDPAQSQAAHSVAMAALHAVDALQQPHFDLLHCVISSTVLPRRAAISAGVLMFFSPSSVARTTL